MIRQPTASTRTSPLFPDSTLFRARLLVNAPATRIDRGWLGERPFVNVVTGGFGARVTAETDPALKKSLGGLAYLLTGVSRAREFQPCRGRFRAEGFAWEGMFLAQIGRAHV